MGYVFSFLNDSECLGHEKKHALGHFFRISASLSAVFSVGSRDKAAPTFDGCWTSEFEDLTGER